jgi:hypothetical protein
MLPLVIPDRRRDTRSASRVPDPSLEARPHTPRSPSMPSDHSPANTAVQSRRLVTVPALPAMAGTLRDAVADFLSGYPRSHDAQRIVTEFFTTALIENRCNCCPHEQIILTVDADEYRVRLEVSYHLTLFHRPIWKRSEITAYGRGVTMLNALTNYRWGHDGHFHIGELRYCDDDQTWWAELTQTPAADHGHRRSLTADTEAARTLQSIFEKAAEQHHDDLISQLAQTRHRHGITSHILDRRLHLPKGTTRDREFGRDAALALAGFAAWSRALGLTMHLIDQYGRVLPAWMPNQPPHETDAAFEARRLMRTADLRRDAIPCDLPVLAEHLGITAASWREWNAGITDPDLLTFTRACVALEVRIVLIPLWREHTLTDLRAMQSDSNWNPTTQPTEPAPPLPEEPL